MAHQGLARRLIRAKTRLRWAVREVEDRLQPAPSRLQCPICEHRAAAAMFAEHRARCAFGGGRLVRHECPRCGVIFGSDRMLAMSAAELEREYAELYATYDEGDTTDSELAAFLALRPNRQGLYLNYGCGRWSKSIERAREIGYRVLGYDPHVGDGDADWLLTRPEQLETLRFDGIMSHNVLEHLPRPIDTLRWLRSLLTEGGTMAHATPCYRYCYEYSRFHLFFFAGASPAHLAAAAGLCVAETPHDHVRLFRPVGVAPPADDAPDYRAEYTVGAPSRCQPGETCRYDVRVTNRGAQVWLPGGLTAVHLGVKVVVPLASLREPVARFRLPRAVLPGETAVVSVDLEAPRTPGRYEIAHALVWEQRAWFDEAIRFDLDVGAASTRS